MIQKVQKVVDVPQIEIEEQVVEVPVAKHVHVPMIQKVQKIVDPWKSCQPPALLLSSLTIFGGADMVHFFQLLVKKT